VINPIIPDQNGAQMLYPCLLFIKSTHGHLRHLIYQLLVMICGPR